MTMESEDLITKSYIPNVAKDKTVPKAELNSKYFLLTLNLAKTTPRITPKIPAPATAKSAYCEESKVLLEIFFH